MHYVHAHRMFEAAPDYHVDTSLPAEQVRDDRQFRRNFVATFTGGLVTGAVLATAGVLAMNAYNNAMQTEPIAQSAEQAQTVETADSSSFSVGAQVLKTTEQN